MKTSIEMPELDRKKTKTAVEGALLKYRMYKTITFEERTATITSSYTEKFHGPTNVTSDQTASIAIYNVEEPERRRRYCERIEMAVSRLHPKERLLIEERYMKDDYVKDYAVYNHSFDPPISAVTYSSIRWKAFYKLALILSLGVPGQAGQQREGATG
ncbi:ArpU family transcriptional regulator [Paenibacillus chitinolyticus]|uniref:ArpU family phage packaging/lysis transcriptional regulator n=1 Tax=Paenibacillus chitinolyticus TaxID=79263 RepID=UPI0026E4E096|nr:ArpU family phage packaging/lysis transcriptional regulator [Paenibacillus chitinolyticus]GKS13315.1 ArpU family transcriptional regulator [Paenibacillus chitinolyticus]